MVVNIVVKYSCTRVLLYTRTLKQTETEETINFFVTFLSLVAFQLSWGGAPLPPGYAYVTSSRYFTELKDLSLDGLAIYAECLRNDSPNKFFLPKQTRKDQFGRPRTR